VSPVRLTISILLEKDYFVGEKVIAHAPNRKLSQHPQSGKMNIEHLS
jgi:hypothetical protein